MTITLPESYPTYAGDFELPKKLPLWMEMIVNEYADRGVPLPDRQYWTIGTTAHDCEQAVITVQQMIIGTPANPMELVQCNGPRTVTFMFEVVRCAPMVDNKGRPPSAEVIEAASVDPVIDMEIMLDLVKYFDEWNRGVMVTVDVISPAGGLQGAIATYTVGL